MDVGSLLALLFLLGGAAALLFGAGFTISALRERGEAAATPGQPRLPSRGGSQAQRRAAREAAAGRRRRWLSGPVLGAVIGAVGALALALWLAPPLALLHRSGLPFEALYGNAAVSFATYLGGAGNQVNPLAGDFNGILAGRKAYSGSCAICHGDKGDGRGAWGQSTYPPATDLTSQTTRAYSDAQLYWIVKNGLSFAGMPGFGSQYSEQNLWSLVTYLRALQRHQSDPLGIATPTAEQLALGDIQGNAVQRGAAVYFAQGCHLCHGAVGEAPGGLALESSDNLVEAVRKGDDAMPFYGNDRITDAELADLTAYLDTFPVQQQALHAGAPAR